MHCKPPATINSSGQINPGTVTGGTGGSLASNTVTGGATGNLASGTVAQVNMASDNLPFNNLLTNPMFNYAQLQTPGTLTTIGDNTTGPDGWKVNRDTADVQYQRLSNAGAGLSATSPNRGSFKKITNAGKFMVYQPLESLVTRLCSNQTVEFTIRMNLSAAHNMRLGFVIWTAGADQVVPQPIAPGNWGASGVQPTFNANFSFPTFVSVASGIGASGWSMFNTFGEFTAGQTLLVCVITDSAFAIGDTIDLYEASIDIGNTGRFVFKGLTPAEDLGRVERRFEKSYDNDVPSGTSSAVSALDGVAASTAHVEPIRYRQRKIFAPTVTLFSSTGASAKWRDTTGAADLTATAQDTGLAATAVALTASTVGNVFKGHYTIDSQL